MDIPTKNIDFTISFDDYILSKEIYALMQKGYIKSPSFFGNIENTDTFTSFLSSLNAVSNYSGYSSPTISETVNTDVFTITSNQNNEIQKKAASIASYGGVSYDDILDFLYMLVAVDDINDMSKISNVLEIEELNNSYILRNVGEILAVPGLEKCAFMATALASLLKAFSKYSTVVSYSNSSSSGNINISSSSISSLVQNIASGSFAIGQLLSEQITGERIPSSVIAKNPMMLSPSWIGKTFMGESPSSIHVMDLNYPLNKKIGVYTKPSGGIGTLSFGLQNLNSAAMNITQFVSKIIFGSSNISAGSYKEQYLNNTIDKIKTQTGVTLAEDLFLNKADTAIPLMMSLSSCFTNSNSCLFSTDDFQNGWNLSSCVSLEISKNNSGLFRAIRGLAT